MKKITLDDFNKFDLDIQNLLDQKVKEILDKQNAETEYLCAAMLRHTGCTPDEIEICTQNYNEQNSHGLRIWVRKRNEIIPDEINDSTRLDWAINNFSKFKTILADYFCEYYGKAQNPREAIDAAMREDGKNEKS